VKLIELKRDMDAQFTHVDERFGQVDARFAQVDARFARVDERLARLELRIDSLERRVTEEGETTRRHFDVVAERIHSEIHLALEHTIAASNRLTGLEQVNSAGHAGFRGMLDEHDVRLRKLEGR
jgi:archaellum component FlaC